MKNRWIIAFLTVFTSCGGYNDNPVKPVENQDRQYFETAISKALDETSKDVRLDVGKDVLKNLSTISLQIQDAWDNLESTYRQTQIAKKSVECSVENLRINREHYINGMKNMTELLDAQRQWQQALTLRNTANCEYLQAKTRYLILTGRREAYRAAK